MISTQRRFRSSALRAGLVLAAAAALAIPAVPAVATADPERDDPDSPFTDARPFPWAQDLPGVGALQLPPPGRALLPASDLKPGAFGQYDVVRSRVDAGNVVPIEAPAGVEFRAELTEPVAAPGRKPLVVFLHGMHASCYRGDEVDYNWPCAAGWQPVPSYQGYRYTADRLASRGILTTSISADGINGQDQYLYVDSGTTARADLVIRHLRQIHRAATGRTSYYPRSFARQVDLDRVVLVGHSRGATGVMAAGLRLTQPGTPWLGLRAVVSLAGTMTQRSAIPGVPTFTMLPQCDGDVFTLESQQFIDTGSRIPGDRTLRGAIWIPGGNHNFLNTQWTPGLSAAPSVNDGAAYDVSDGTCARGRRLGSAPERRVARSYLGAIVTRYTQDRDRMADLIDGSPVRPGDIGDTPTRTAATGGSAMLLARAWRGAVSTSGAVAAGRGIGLASAERTGWNDVETPHWQPSVVFGAGTVRQRALMVEWEGAGAALTELGRARDLSAARTVQARVAVDVARWQANPRVRLIVSDRAGRTASAPVPANQLTQLSADTMGRKLWGQSVSVPVGRIAADNPRIDLTRITRFGLAPTRGAGRVWVLDAWARSTDTGVSRAGPVSAIAISGTATAQGDQFRITVTATRLAPGARNVKVRYQAYPFIEGFDIKRRGRLVIPVGQTDASTTFLMPTPDITIAAFPDRQGLNVVDYTPLEPVPVG